MVPFTLSTIPLVFGAAGFVSLWSILFSSQTTSSLEGLELPTDEVHDSIRAFAMVEVGFILERQGLPAQALSFYLQGLDLLTEIGMCPISGYLLIDIGNVYYNQKQYDLASDKYNEAIKVFFNYD
jgi:tetratricopeptide (TPR) repeat protein